MHRSPAILDFGNEALDLIASAHIATRRKHFRARVCEGGLGEERHRFHVTSHHGDPAVGHLAAEAPELKVAAVIDGSGARAPSKAMVVASPRIDSAQFAVLVQSGIGDYRAGDELVCQTLAPEDFARALNRDVLVPRPAGRFLFGRLINRDEEKLQVLPLDAGGRQQVVANPPWIGVAVRMTRGL